jgi:hypothetical protein
MAHSAAMCLPAASTLRVFGPRESKQPGIYDKARAFQLEVLREIRS